ncbi:hypothetical protein BOTBODRAFT_30959 [Botryobasidium botryosum FD-172 SS1]|uniref:Brix domain-containing protein n=1 Tax=Botryobasidium botryosum (strain FD-172 SS1) TaxID=930990 RepID=A0A067MNE5_BOTB1|nr:hypothetical protein BOTBODRAFT_30959 [Botryobasidium botryosum FD-172 SS1]
MARRRKNRTHLKGANASAPKDAADPKAPKSFIVRHGQVGHSIAQLVRDMRKVMEPNTATRLKERARNKLKDYISIGPSLSVTHIVAFTLTPVAPSLRIIRLSAGPTLSFRIERYSLTKDILNASRRARSMGMEYLSPPLLVLASFPAPGPSTPPHLTLLAKTFQSLFPPLAPSTISLSSARRVVLVSYNAEQGTIDFRHYLITIRPYGVSRRVRKVLEGTTKTAAGKVVDLSSHHDIADYVLRNKDGGDGGYESASSASEADPEEATVRLAGDYVGRNNRKGEKRAVRLDEIGPRMELRLVKIVEGLPGKEGGVLFHEFVKKAPSEAAALKAAAAARAKLRKERREEQERNVARKKRKDGAEDDEDDEEGEEDSESGEEDGEEGEDDEGDDEAWDDEADVSEGEDGESSEGEDGESSEGEAEDDGEESEVEEKQAPRPMKRHKPTPVKHKKGGRR